MATRKKPSTTRSSRRPARRQVQTTRVSGRYVASVPPPPKKLDRYTRYWQAIFFMPFLLIEFWFAWSLILEMFTNCSYVDAFLLPYWCEPNGKIYVILMLAMVLGLLALGLFAARIALRQGVRWKFLLLYTGLVLIGQYMLWRLLIWLLFRAL